MKYYLNIYITKSKLIKKYNSKVKNKNKPFLLYKLNI